MPRTARASVGGICYHVMNRGNGSARVFHKDRDYEAFVSLIDQSCDRLPMRVLAYCLMPNHFHLVLWPHGDGDLGTWMQWLMTAHVRRYHRHHGTSGHVWQGRFRAFPIQQDAHLLTVMRYIERNPLRARLVDRAQDWAWSSLGWLGSAERPRCLHAGPIDRLHDWLQCVNRAESAEELEILRGSAQRGTPFGTPMWIGRTAAQLGLESAVRPRGRPRKHAKK